MIAMFAAPVSTLRNAVHGALDSAREQHAPAEVAGPLDAASRLLDGVLRAAEVIGDDLMFWFTSPVHSAIAEAKVALAAWQAWLDGATQTA
jgi:hypothetical protein